MNETTPVANGTPENVEPMATPHKDLEETQEENLIDQANKAAERLEEANKKLSTLLDRNERLEVRKTLGGKADAGQESETKDEKDKKGALGLLKGTGFEDYIN